MIDYGPATREDVDVAVEWAAQEGWNPGVATGCGIARHRLVEDFGCARMYNGPAPELPWSEIYGITTFELG